MKPFTSFHELDALGEGLSKDYMKALEYYHRHQERQKDRDAR